MTSNQSLAAGPTVVDQPAPERLLQQVRQQARIMGVRLELTWPHKDEFLLVPKDDDGKPVWVSPGHPAAREVRLTREVTSIGDVTADRRADHTVFIGDSLDAMRVLCEVPEFADRYRGKVKLIYADPPFNTGETFDHYDDWMEHATWLSFMRDRLVLMKELLADDGSAWIHLDDAEVHRMRCLMDEVFGASNFVGTVVWQKADSTRNDAKGLSVDHDYVMIYRKTPSWRVNRLPRTAEADARFSSPDGDPDPWFDGDPTAPGARTHQGMVYAIQQPITGKLVYPARGTHWRFGQARVLEMMSEWAPYELRDIKDDAKRAELCGVPSGEVRGSVMAAMVKGDLEAAARAARRRYDEGNWPSILLRSGGKGGLGRKAYVPKVGQVPGTWWDNETAGHNRKAKAELKRLFPDANPFSTPKPEKLLQRIVHIGSNPGDIVFDPFAGSGTTAAVAHKMGRRWATSELSSSTADTFVIPRLTQVICGEDPGGITDAVDWKGGGGFRVVVIEPSLYEVGLEGMIFLRDDVSPTDLARAMAGQMRFTYTPEDAPFCGRRGRMRLAVVPGVVGVEEIDELLDKLPDGTRLTLAAGALLPGAADHLTKASRGSRALKIPRDVFARTLRSARDPEPGEER